MTLGILPSNVGYVLSLGVPIVFELAAVPEIPSWLLAFFFSMADNSMACEWQAHGALPFLSMAAVTSC